MDYDIATHLGEADTPNSFVQRQKEIIAANKEMLPLKDRAGQRAQHPKVHATLDATVQVRDLDAGDKDLQVGIFSNPEQCYAAQIRFSNSSKFVDNPKGGDAHGMAIKLFDVPGAKFEKDPNLGELAEKGAGTFDLILINNKTFFEGNLLDYRNLNVQAGPAIGFQRNMRPFFKGLWAMARVWITTKFVDPDLGAAIANTSDQTPLSPFHETFFSTTPYLLGPDHAVKYIVRPSQSFATVPAAPDAQRDENYLNKRMRRELGESDIRFVLAVEVKSKEDKHLSIENPRQDWEGCRTVTLADITIAKHADISDAAWQNLRFGRETHRYNIWNVTADHRPLGILNRLRREVYRELHRARTRGDITS